VAEAHVAEFLPESGVEVSWWTSGGGRVVIPFPAAAPPISNDPEEMAKYQQLQQEYEKDLSTARFSVAAARDGKVRKLIDLKELKDFDIEESATSPDGCWAAAGNEFAVALRGIPCGASNLTGKQLWVLDDFQAIPISRPKPSLEFSPDSSRLAVGGDGRAPRVWDLRAGDRVKDPQVLPETSGSLHTQIVRFAPGGTWLAAAGNEIVVWNLRLPKPFERPAFRFPSSSFVDTVDFSRDGRFLVSGRGTIALWDLSGSDPRQSSVEIKPRLFDASDDADTLFFDASSRWLVTVGRQSVFTCDVQLWPLRIADLLVVARQRAESGGGNQN
jgi:WD40 repeat protein